MPRGCGDRSRDSVRSVEGCGHSVASEQQSGGILGLDKVWVPTIEENMSVIDFR